MSFSLATLAIETTQTSGTGSLTLLGAKTGYVSILAALGNKSATFCCTDLPYGGTNIEVFRGTLSGGTTLARDRVLMSTNGGALVNWPAGGLNKDVYIFQPAEESAGTVSQSLTANGTAYTNTLADYGLSFSVDPNELWHLF